MNEDAVTGRKLEVLQIAEELFERLSGVSQNTAHAAWK